MLDVLLQVPYAWGWTSAARNAPALLGQLHVVDAPAAAATAVASWFVRAVADAQFVPVDECSALVEDGAGVATAFDCARGTSLMVFIFLDRFALGMIVDEAAAAASELALDDAGRLPLRALKIALAASAPGDGTIGYFLALHLEAAFETWSRMQPRETPWRWF